MVDRIKSWVLVNSAVITAIGEAVAIIAGVFIIVAFGFLGA